MKYYFLGSFFSDDRIIEVKRDSIGAISNANNLLQRNMIIGLNNLVEELEVITLPNIGAYPKRYKKLTFRSSITSYEKTKQYTLGFLNLPVIKHISRLISLLKYFRENNLPCDEKFVIYIYDLELAFLLFIFFIKSRYSQVHICLIVPDLPGMTGDSRSFLGKIRTKITKKITNTSLSYVDSFSLISENMINKLNVAEKPFTVIEGIYNENLERENTKSHLVKDTFNLFYSGALDKRNGVLNLVSAFKLIENEKYRLYIAGDGELKDFILTEQDKDSRIIYLGQLCHDDVIKYQNESTLLINPRQPIEEFTYYSFPSKTMEYFASGIPTIMYRLPGVPVEYFNYCTVLDDMSIVSLYNEIIKICEFEYEGAMKIAEKAKFFILSKKNPLEQCSKLVKVIT